MNFLQTQFPTCFIQQPENISIVEQLLSNLTKNNTNSNKQYSIQTTTTGILLVSFANENIQRKIIQNYSNDFIVNYETVISNEQFDDLKTKIQITKIDFVPSEKVIPNSNEIQKKLIEQTKETELLQYEINERKEKNQFEMNFVRKNNEIRELQTMIISLYELCNKLNIHLTNCSIQMNTFYSIENYILGSFIFSLNNKENDYYQFINEFISLSFSYQNDSFSNEINQKGRFTPLEITLIKALSSISEQFLSNINADLFTLVNIQEAFQCPWEP